MVLRVYKVCDYKNITTFFFPGDDGGTFVDEFSTVNYDHFYTGKNYYIFIINNELVYKLHVCVTYKFF